MSRIGRKALEIPKGVQVSITKDIVSAKGSHTAGFLRDFLNSAP